MVIFQYTFVEFIIINQKKKNHVHLTCQCIQLAMKSFSICRKYIER